MLKDEKVDNTINFFDGNTSGSFEGGKVGVRKMNSRGYFRFYGIYGICFLGSVILIGF